MRKYLVAGNWKMNGDSTANAELCGRILAGLEGLDGANGPELAICPPFPYLESLGSRLTGSSVSLGAQNVSEHAAGAYTGEVSAAMLRDLGCKYVIVGHSERRAMMHETNELVAAKFAAVLREGIKPVLCVGETLEDREAGRTEPRIADQVEAVVAAVGIEAFREAVVAYEPVWAIGTGKTATPEQAQDVHRFIRNILAGSDVDIADGLQILYGGSVKGANAAGLFAMADIDGGLIGGASLDAAEFLAIARAAGAASPQVRF